ncbi:HNH endonuclease [Micromonospora polyrhachis]|uniref:Putative restriction endonuclease n=1 Tax=Micromonospora polyrhachis TaxID=1282883 RepID=A0A7W7SNI7_9ACTN|nr:HNH endonuclease [Micromonospora polyrhachis]MBB4956835.1 putative restriction endonuclease [Micromonospora polyrhachis]
MPEASVMLRRLERLRQHQKDGRRAPHKPLLLLLALGRFARYGTSALPWSEAESLLGDLLAEYGPASRTSRRQGAAYPFTRLRSDGIWVLDRDVPMDLVRPLVEERVVGSLVPALERAFRDDPGLVKSVARTLVESHFPDTVAADVLVAVGLDPDEVRHSGEVIPEPDGDARRRDPKWPSAVLRAWDCQCAFCGFDGQLGNWPVGIEAAHVRWFKHGGPDDLDNGLALCVLHHKLFDRGALGLTKDLRIQVSASFTTRTEAGRILYRLHGRPLRPRPGTAVPAAQHVAWHQSEVFRGVALQT